MRSSWKKIFLVTGLSGAVVSVLMLQVKSDEGGRNQVPRLSTANGVVRPSAAPLAILCNRERIDHLLDMESELEWSNELIMDAAALLASSKPGGAGGPASEAKNLVVRGLLMESRLADEGGRYSYLRLKNPIIHGAPPQLKPWLEQGFVIERDARGAAVAIGVPPQSDPEAVNTARLLVPLLTMSRSDSPQIDSWEVTESDTTGPVRVRYQADGSSIERRRSALAASGHRESQSMFQVRFDSLLHLKDHGPGLCSPDVEGSERTELLSQGQRVAGTNTTRLRKTLVQGQSLHAEPAAALRQKIRGFIFSPLDPQMKQGPANVVQNFDSVAQTIPWGELLKKLSDASQTDENEAELFEALRAHLMIQPGRSQEVMERLGSSSHDTKQAGILARALAAAGHKEAQKALLDLVNTKRTEDPVFSFKLLGLVSMVEAPNAESLERLESFRQDDRGPPWLKSSIELMEANVASKRRGEDPITAQNLEARLLSEYPAADPKRRQQILSVLGNLGGSGTLSLVESQWTNADVETRIRMANALRFVPAERATRRLLHVLQEDPDTPVRQKAAYALTFRRIGVESREILTQALAQEKEAGVRSQIEALLKRGSST